MNELNCEFVRDVYPDLLDGAVDAATSNAVLAHLATCADCRADAEAVRAIFAGAVVAPPSLHTRVMTEYQAPVAHTSRWGIRYIAMAATVAAAVIGGTVLFQMQNEVVPPTAMTDVPIGAVSVEAALVSGKGSLQDLTVEELERLLGDIES